MAGNIVIRAELQEERRFIEEQRIELQRQRHETDIQFRRTADVQAELDGLKAMLLGKAPISDRRRQPRATVTVITLHGGRSFHPVANE